MPIQSENVKRTLLLAVLAATSSLLYWFAYSRVYNLFDLVDRPLFDLYTYSRTHPSARWWLAGAFLIQGGLYWIGWRTARQVHGRSAWAVVLGGAVVSSAVLLFMFPFGAADIFDYIMHGRILAVHHANPFYAVARNFPQDPFVAYAAWRNTPSVYGPLWTFLTGAVAWLAARLAGDSVLPTVLAFKLLSGVFVFAGIAVVAAILRRKAPQYALAGALLLAWNPVILFETFGNGHNDIAMAFWILVAVLFMTRRRYTLAIVALVTGALFKFIPALLLPAAGLIALRRLPTRRGRLRFLLVTGSATLLVLVLAYLPFWRGPDVLTAFQHLDLFTTSLPAFLRAWLQPRWGKERATNVISYGAALLTVLFALWRGFRASKSDAWLAFPRAGFHVILFYLLFTCLWFQEWYTIWPAALAAVIPRDRAFHWAIVVNYAGLTKPLLFAPLWLWLRPLPPQSWRELRLGPAVLALAWLFLLYRLWATKGGARRIRLGER
jgi:hypothetical protein